MWSPSFRESFDQLLNRAFSSANFRDADGKKVKNAEGLASEVGVSAGTLSDWRTGKKAPRPFSTVIDDVAGYFDLDVNAATALHLAAIWWWIKKNRTEAGKYTPVGDALQRALRGLTALPSLERDLKPDRTFESIHERSVVYGTSNVLRATTELLKSAVATGAEKVRISYGGGMDGFEPYPAERREMRKRAIELRRAGTNIDSIWRARWMFHHQLDFAHALLGLEEVGQGAGVHMMSILRADSDEPAWAFGPSPRFEPVYNYVIVPGAALLMFSSEQDRDVDSGVLLFEPSQVSLLARHFDRVHQHGLIVKPRPQNRFIPYHFESASRAAFQINLLSLPHPRAGYQNGAHLMEGEDRLLAWVKSNDAENETFYRALEAKAEFFDIVPVNTFRDLSDRRKLARGQPSIFEQLYRNLIFLLTNYADQYHLHLVDIKEAEAWLPIMRFAAHESDVTSSYSMDVSFVEDGDAPLTVVSASGPQEIVKACKNLLVAVVESGPSRTDYIEPIKFLESRLPIRAKRLRGPASTG
jgi:transcriptional regulator with XRE-family HTH domain